MNEGKDSIKIDFETEREYNIVDITFARKDTDDVNLLYEMNLIRREKLKYAERKTQALAKGKVDEAGKNAEKWEKENKKYLKLKLKYMSKYNQFAGDDGCG